MRIRKSDSRIIAAISYIWFSCMIGMVFWGWLTYNDNLVFATLPITITVVLLIGSKGEKYIAFLVSFAFTLLKLVLATPIFILLRGVLAVPAWYHRHFSAFIADRKLVSEYYYDGKKAIREIDIEDIDLYP